MAYSPYFFNKNSTGTSQATGSSYQNGSGSTIAQGVLVSVNSSGQIAPTDTTSETSVLGIVGFTTVSMPNGSTAQIIDNGRLENITTSFIPGTHLYLDTTGNLTNIQPSVGVNGFIAGDFVVSVGMVVVNQFNPSLYDLKLMIAVIGQL